MSIPVVSKMVVESTPKQREFAEAVFSGKYTRLLFGGGVGGGKTIGSLMVLYALCKIYPGSRWIIVRKDRPTLKRTTLPSFWKSCPMPFFHPDRFNKSDFVATASNGSTIEFVAESYSEDPNLHKFDGFEPNGFLLEEANELHKDTYTKCIERCGRWKLDPMPAPIIILTCNPHQGFLKEMFFDPWEKGELAPPYFFVRSLVTDNPHHDPEYLKNLEEIKLRSPSHYRRLIQGSWEAEDIAEQLISWDALYSSEDRLQIPDDIEEDMVNISLGVDVGRHGKDKSVWVVLKGTHEHGMNIEYIQEEEKTDMVEVADITKRLIIEFEIPHDRVFIDVVGIGGGAYDILNQDGYFVQEIVGGAKPVEQSSDGGFKFFNFNAQIGWNVKTQFEDGNIGNLTNEELRADLASQGYDIQGERSIRLWSKDKIKEKIHRSPDIGDSFKYAVWGQIHDIISPLPSFEVM